jgi:hypothetical protein
MTIVLTFKHEKLSSNNLWVDSFGAWLVEQDLVLDWLNKTRENKHLASSD